MVSGYVAAGLNNGLHFPPKNQHDMGR